MQLFVDERQIGPLTADVATTVGEVVEALGMQVEAGRIVVAVELDGDQFHAASDGPWLARRAPTVGTLRLITSSPAELARDLRHDVRIALELIAGKLDLAIEGLGRGERHRAGQLLAQLLEELRLVLVLDREVSLVDGRPAVADAPRLERVGEELIAAQHRADVGETVRLLESGLAPLVRSWRDAAG
ncbi:MAG TPA: hypothetical protein VFD92_25495 [Candidatus Binatia bacterium]|nr:hypothetical protein [Candidatus Binatia bacterium]